MIHLPGHLLTPLVAGLKSGAPAATLRVTVTRAAQIHPLAGGTVSFPAPWQVPAAELRIQRRTFSPADRAAFVSLGNSVAAGRRVGKEPVQGASTFTARRLHTTGSAFDREATAGEQHVSTFYAARLRRSTGTNVETVLDLSERALRRRTD